MPAAVVGLLLAPGGAAAATKPTVTTGAVANVAPTSAVVNGTVNPRRAATTYWVQYGTTRALGAATPATAAGSGNRTRRVAIGLSGLAPATTYHYRLVARNAEGTSRGARRTFKTRRQPLGVSLAASPNPLRAGDATTLAGVLSGTGSANRHVVLQSNPYPYTQGFRNAADVHLTNADGSFSFPILSVPVNTQFRVLMPSRPQVVSPVVVAQAAVRVSVRTRVRRERRRGVIRFAGRITPAADGSGVLIQKLKRGSWVTIAETFARHARRGGKSLYAKRVRQRRGGRYRVVATASGPYAWGVSRSVRRSVRR